MLRCSGLQLVWQLGLGGRLGAQVQAIVDLVAAQQICGLCSRDADREHWLLPRMR